MTGIVTFTNLFPSAALPWHGLFVQERMTRVVEALGCPWQVVAPRPFVPPPLSWLRRNPFAGLPTSETVRGVKVHHPAYPHYPGFSVAQQARRMARGSLETVGSITVGGSWILDAHYLYPDGVAAASIAEELSLPYVLSARGSDVHVLARNPSVLGQIRQAIRGAQAVIAVSGDLARRLTSLAGLPAGTVRVVRNGVDLQRFSPGDRMQARRTLHLSQARKLILGVGRLVPGKGFLRAARALERIPDADLVLVGDGPERRRIEAAAPGRCHVLGALPPDRVAEAYRAADVLVLPSQREGWPNVINEALASGLPVVATSVGGIPEILTDPAVGALVPFGQPDALAAALRRFLDTPPTADRVRAFAERYSWDEPVATLVSVMRTVPGTKFSSGTEASPVRE